MKDAQQAQQAQLIGALREAEAEAKHTPELRAKLDAALHECAQLKVHAHTLPSTRDRDLTTADRRSLPRLVQDQLLVSKLMCAARQATRRGPVPSVELLNLIFCLNLSMQVVILGFHFGHGIFLTAARL